MNNKAIADAQRFFRLSADMKWGYLIRKKKERTARHEVIANARLIYWRGIRNAWNIYTKDNKIVRQAQETLDKAISQAHDLYLKDEEEMSDTAYERSKKLFVKAVYRAHDDCARVVAPVWKAFTKDMKKKY